MPDLNPAQFAVVSRVPPLAAGRPAPAPVVHSTHNSLEEAHEAYEMAKAGTETNPSGIGSAVRWSIEPHPLPAPPESIYRRAQRERAERLGYA